jgi:hypothetical protein
VHPKGRQLPHQCYSVCVAGLTICSSVLSVVLEFVLAPCTVRWQIFQERSRFLEVSTDSSFSWLHHFPVDRQAGRRPGKMSDRNLASQQLINFCGLAQSCLGQQQSRASRPAVISRWA